MRAKITQLGTKRYWIKKSWKAIGDYGDGEMGYALCTWTQTPGLVIGTKDGEWFPTKKQAQAKLDEIVKAHGVQHGS